MMLLENLCQSNSLLVARAQLSKHPDLPVNSTVYEHIGDAFSLGCCFSINFIC
jgi:hypothetical protein